MPVIRAHGSFYNLCTKYVSLPQGGANPFINPTRIPKNKK